MTRKEIAIALGKSESQVKRYLKAACIKYPFPENVVELLTEVMKCGNIKQMMQLNKAEYDAIPTVGSNKHRYHTASAKEKTSIAMKAYRAREDIKLKTSIENLGENNPMFGRHHSKETKEALSNVWANKTPEDRRKYQES